MTDDPNKPVPGDNLQYVVMTPDMLQARHQAGEEIDLREVWSAIWRGKWIIIAVTAIFAVSAVIYALRLPNIYKSEALLSPVSEKQQGGMAGIAGQFGGLASLAGVNLGGGKANKTVMAIEILKSREFFRKLIVRHNILPDLMAAKVWDSANNSIIYNEKIFLAEKGEWLHDGKTPEESIPSMQKAKAVFNGLLYVEQSEDSGLVSISIEHISPTVAKQWVDWLVYDINLEMKNRDKQEAEMSIAYLQSKIDTTQIFEHKTLLYQLIEEQVKTLMFAEVRDEYVFKTIDPALVTESKYKPKRMLIVIFGVILGGIFSVIVALIRHFLINKSLTRAKSI
jgi:uncharacterized protein involved in exopolysaccharide biosynthesis